jgi:CHAT domain-containing protein
MLLAPVQDELAGKTRLSIVPDDELYSIPLQALVDPLTGRYLVEDRTAYVVPSLSTLVSMRHRGSHERRDLLVVGDPAMKKQELLAESLRGELTPLPFAQQEADSVAAAQRRFIGGHERFRHPFFWAGFKGLRGL